jgi:hypothetical protein
MSVVIILIDYTCNLTPPLSVFVIEVRNHQRGHIHKSEQPDYHMLYRKIISAYRQYYYAGLR